MRKILFRGKAVENGRFLYGYYFHQKKRNGKFGQSITEFDRDADFIFGWHGGKKYEVIPETVGQYTGLKDKKGKKIFEGDIVSEQPFVDSDERRNFVVRFANGGFNVNNIIASHDLVIVGNIYDNSELTEAK